MGAPTSLTPNQRGFEQVQLQKRCISAQLAPTRPFCCQSTADCDALHARGAAVPSQPGAHRRVQVSALARGSRAGLLHPKCFLGAARQLARAGPTARAAPSPSAAASLYPPCAGPLAAHPQPLQLSAPPRAPQHGPWCGPLHLGAPRGLHGRQGLQALARQPGGSHDDGRADIADALPGRSGAAGLVHAAEAAAAGAPGR
jgi:hypothetical protein